MRIEIFLVPWRALIDWRIACGDVRGGASVGGQENTDAAIKADLYPCYVVFISI
jgi:hypothetical protein